MQVIAKRHRPLLVLVDKVITCHYGKIYSLDIESGKSEYIAALPIAKWKRVLSRFRVFERLLRIEAKTAAYLDEESIVVSCGGVWNVNLKNGKTVKEFTYRNGMSSPTRMSRIEGIDGFDDCIAYGEYILNPQRNKPAAVFTRKLDSADWEMAYEFPAGAVRHIHSVVPSAENKCVYILTGDLDNESGIWVAKDNFKTVYPLVHGLQKYRTVALVEGDKGFLYATDTALEQNYIYFMSQSENDEWDSEAVTDIDGSCISASCAGENALFSTTVEADESIRGWRSWINMKKGAGIKSDYAQLISVDKNTLEFKKITQFKKDMLPYKLFQYGHFKIFDAPQKKAVLLYPVAVKKYDGKLLKLGYSELEVK